MTKRRDWLSVPSRSWEWNEGMSVCGVHTAEHQLVWWSRPAGPGGYFGEVAIDQSFDDFLASGPPVYAPQAVSDEIRLLLTGGSSL
jgi:hypothetical protein